MTLNEVIKHFGTEREAAYRLGYTEQALKYWRKQKKIPFKAQQSIELVTKGKLKSKRVV